METDKAARPGLLSDEAEGDIATNDSTDEQELTPKAGAMARREGFEPPTLRFEA